MNPKRADEGTLTRRFFCIHYGKCLLSAAHNAWPGFTCETCPDYQAEPIGAEEAHQEALVCRVLRLLVSGADRHGFSVAELLDGLHDVLSDDPRGC